MDKNFEYGGGYRLAGLFHLAPAAEAENESLNMQIRVVCIH